MRAAAVARLAIALTLALSACQGDAPAIELRFDRTAVNVADHPFPTDAYLDSRGLLAAFSEDQLANNRLLNRLLVNAQTGYWSAGFVRVPFTPSPDVPAGWIDESTVAASVGMWRTDGPSLVPVPLAEHRVWTETNTVTFRPAAPVAPGTYAVVVRRDPLRTRGGARIAPSPDYALLSRDGDPATDANFSRMDAIDPAFTGRSETLAFFQFTTKADTGQMQLLQAYVEGQTPVDRAGDDLSLAVTAFLPESARQIAAAGQTVAPSPAAVAAVLNPQLPDSPDAACPAACVNPCQTTRPTDCPATCAPRPCIPTAGIARMAVGELSTPVFISDPVPDTAALLFNGTIRGRDLQAPFHPGNPASLSAATPFRTIPYVIFYPAVHQDPTPVIVGVHGFTLSKSTMAALASAACSAGFALVAIDLYQHGDRQAAIAVPEGGFSTKLDPVLLGAGVRFPDPFLNPTMLGRTRDKLRQSVVDELSLIRLLATADGADPRVDLDGDGVPDDFGAIHLVGQSLGAILGTIIAAVSPHLSRAVLNVPGGGLPAIVRDSRSLSHDVDLLLYATAGAEGFGLLAGSPRRLLPMSDEHELFELVAGTVLAAADPLTFAPAVLSGALGGAKPRVLVQLAADDAVVPNNANARLVQALASTAPTPADFPLWVDGGINQAYFDLGLPEHDLSAGLTPMGVSQFQGSHVFLLDGVIPEVTAQAQLQAMQFLLAP
jgi:dienelactone hydrolase